MFKNLKFHSFAEIHFSTRTKGFDVHLQIWQQDLRDLPAYWNDCFYCLNFTNKLKLLQAAKSQMSRKLEKLWILPEGLL